MEIPQKILDQFSERPDYIEWIKSEPAVFVYLDLTNMLHWQDTLGWRFRIEDVISQLKSYHNVKDVKVYYGSNGRDEQNSKAFHDRIKKTGAILRSKPMKYIIKNLNEGLFFQRKTLTLFDTPVKEKITDLLEELQKANITIEEPKCNFDVEMTMDILDDSDKCSAVILFSGDSDLAAPLERLKIKGKKIGVCGVRNKVAAELHLIEDKYFDFGRFYTGKRTYF